MVLQIKEKTIRFFTTLEKFYTLNFPKLSIVAAFTIVLVILRRFPYINLIPHYGDYALGLTLLITIFIFRGYISRRMLILSFFICLFLGFIAKVLRVEFLSNLIGFVLFSFIFILVMALTFAERKNLRDTIEE